MKQTFLAFTLLFCISMNGQSQNEPKREKIKYLFSLMHQDSSVNKMFDAISSSMVNRMTTLFKDSIHTKDGVNYSDKFTEIMQKYLKASKENTQKLMNEDMVAVYDKYFAMDDIENFIAFYKSKSGQKMLDKLPEITNDIMTTVTVKYQPEIQQSMMKEIEEMMNDLPKQ